MFEISRNVLKKYSGTASHVEIPEKVTKIADKAFISCVVLRDIKLNDSIKSIETGAFEDCTNLIMINFPNALTSIGMGAFFNCQSLSEVFFDENSSLESIGRYAFKNCTSITKVILPPSLKQIGRFAFAYCNNLLEIYISRTTECENNALEYINPFAKVIWYESPSEVYKDPPSNIAKPSKDWHISENRLTKFSGEKATVSIPPEIEIVESNAFSLSTNIDTISFSNVKIIEKCAFYKSNVRKVNLGGSLLSVEGHAFFGCKNLSTVSFPSSLMRIGSHAFRECSNLKSIEFNWGIQEISAHAFSDCISINKLIFPHSLHTIKKGAFYNCNNIKAVFIPNSVDTIEDFAFLSCKNITFFCEATQKPQKWSNYWCEKDCSINWNVSFADFENIIKGTL